MSNEFAVLPKLSGSRSVRGSAEFLPIRSVYYRKKLPAKLDPIQSMPGITTSTTLTVSPQMNAGLAASGFTTVSQENTDKQTATSPRQTTFRTTFHLFSSSTRNRSRKTQHPLEANGNSQRNLFSSTKARQSNKVENADGMFSIRDFIIEMQKAQPQKNYFSDQVYEHYNSEEVINNPMRFTKYDRLSDPNKYMKKNIFQKDINIPTEVEIRVTNRLYFAESIEEHENEKTLAIHFLGAAEHNIKHLETTLKVLIKEMKIFRKQKESLQEELKELGEEDERIRQELVHIILTGAKRCQDELRQSAIDNQNEKIKVTKDLVCLQRDKINLEKGIQDGLERIQATETVLLGFEAFDLQAEDKNLEAISSQNLRTNMQSSMTNRPIIH